MALVLRKAVLPRNVSFLKCMKGRHVATTSNNNKNNKNPAAITMCVMKRSFNEHFSSLLRRQTLPRIEKLPEESRVGVSHALHTRLLRCVSCPNLVPHRHSCSHRRCSHKLLRTRSAPSVPNPLQRLYRKTGSCSKSGSSGLNRPTKTTQRCNCPSCSASGQQANHPKSTNSGQQGRSSESGRTQPTDAQLSKDSSTIRTSDISQGLSLNMTAPDMKATGKMAPGLSPNIASGMSQGLFSCQAVPDLSSRAPSSSGAAGSSGAIGSSGAAGSRGPPGSSGENEPPSSTDALREICAAEAVCGPDVPPGCSGASPCGCCLPPPCNTKAKCAQAMTAYYYYPYGFWFCGPYHVTNLCVPGGPVRPGPCGPCGPLPPNPGGPCGPCNPGVMGPRGCGPCGCLAPYNCCGKCGGCAKCCIVPELSPISSTPSPDNKLLGTLALDYQPDSPSEKLSEPKNKVDMPKDALSKAKDKVIVTMNELAQDKVILSINELSEAKDNKLLKPVQEKVNISKVLKGANEPVQSKVDGAFPAFGVSPYPYCCLMPEMTSAVPKCLDGPVENTLVHLSNAILQCYDPDAKEQPLCPLDSVASAMACPGGCGCCGGCGCGCCGCGCCGVCCKGCPKGPNGCVGPVCGPCGACGPCGPCGPTTCLPWPGGVHPCGGRACAGCVGPCGGCCCGGCGAKPGCGYFGCCGGGSCACPCGCCGCGCCGGCGCGCCGGCGCGGPCDCKPPPMPPCPKCCGCCGPSRCAPCGPCCGCCGGCGCGCGCCGPCGACCGVVDPMLDDINRSKDIMPADGMQGDVADNTKLKRLANTKVGKKHTCDECTKNLNDGHCFCSQCLVNRNNPKAVSLSMQEFPPSTRATVHPGMGGGRAPKKPTVQERCRCLSDKLSLGGHVCYFSTLSSGLLNSRYGKVDVNGNLNIPLTSEGRAMWLSDSCVNKAPREVTVEERDRRNTKISSDIEFQHVELLSKKNN